MTRDDVTVGVSTKDRSCAGCSDGIDVSRVADESGICEFGMCGFDRCEDGSWRSS